MCSFLAQETVEIVVEGQLKLMESWDENLSDETSDAFIEMKKTVEEEMDKLFCNDTGSTNNTCHTEVTGFSNGSINVMFIIIRIEFIEFLPTVAEILIHMKDALHEADGFLGQYSVDKESVELSKYEY